MGMSLIALLLAQAATLANTTVPDEELAQQRGGFALPNGIDVALTVQTQTSVNGVIVLQSVFRADTGAPTLTVYAPKPGETVAAPTSTGTSVTATSPTVTYDSNGNLNVMPAQPGPSVAVSTNGSGPSAVPTGLIVVPAGNAAVTDNGTISQMVKNGIQTALLQADDLSITHIAGTAFGSSIANSGSDRAIDTTTTIGIDLSNANPTILASAALRVEDVATSAMQFRP